MVNMVKPALQRGWSVLHRPDGALVLVSGARWLVIPRSTPEKAYLLEILDGTRSIPELIMQFRDRFPAVSPNSVVSVLEELQEFGLLVDAAAPVPDELTGSELQKYDRQLAFFAEHEHDGYNRYDYQAKLKRAKVVEIGLGGMGSWIIYGLVGAGVGEIVGVDGDVVDATNLNRQVLYSERDIGRNKAEAARDRIREFNSQVNFVPVPRMMESEVDIEEIVAGKDFLIVTADYPLLILRRWVTEACLRHEVPYIIIGGNMVGPLCVPFKTACYGCYEEMVREADPFYDALVEQVAGIRIVARRSHTGLHPIIGGFVTLEVVKYITGFMEPTTRNRIMRIDLDTMSSDCVDFTRHPNCPYCGSS